MTRTKIIDTVKKINEKVLLKGWVHSYRDKGKIIFFELRDVSGILQCVVWHEDKEVFSSAKKIGVEDVLEVVGKVNQRPKNQVKKEKATGMLEVIVEKIKIIIRQKHYLLKSIKISLKKR